MMSLDSEIAKLFDADQNNEFIGLLAEITGRKPTIDQAKKFIGNLDDHALDEALEYGLRSSELHHLVRNGINWDRSEIIDW